MQHDALAIRFKLPEGLLGRFGVIKLWPDIQVAEDEVIARLRNTAEVLGLECVVLDHMGRRLGEGGEPLGGKDLDFVIHLHFSTPKSYDIFSFVTIWNPPQFFHDFGYRPSVENLLTHDDYLSCRAPGADLHLRRLIEGDVSHLPSKFELFHSLAKPVLPPTLGELKVFYLGINWDRLGQGRRSRHQEVLNLLDEHDCLRIYGPEELRGFKVWEGFKGYQHSLPFDGVSVIEEIHKAGICLAISSEPHKDVAMMSNRLFEGLAAGALIICDENSWARRHFGDTLLYVDMRDGARAVADRILELVSWARDNRAEALALAERAQQIFRRSFTMDASLAQLYEGFPERKAELAALAASQAVKAKARIVFLAPDIGDAAFERQLAAARAHAAEGFEAVLLVDTRDMAAAHAKLAAGTATPSITLQDDAFFARDSLGTAVRRERIGGILKRAFEQAPRDGMLAFVAPNEVVFENHFAMLAAILAGDAKPDYAWSRAILRNLDGVGEPHFSVEPKLDLLSRDPSTPIGLARFLFRADRFDKVLDLLLVSLDIKAATGLALFAEGRENPRASAIINIRAKGHLGIAGPDGTERNIGPELWHDLEAIRDLDTPGFDARNAESQLQDFIRDVDHRMQQGVEGVRVHAAQLSNNLDSVHAAFVELSGRVNTTVAELNQRQLMPDALFLDRLSRGNRRGIIVQLLKALPVPSGFWRLFSRSFLLARSAFRRLTGRG